MIPLERASAYAAEVLEALRPYCLNLAVAGSVRRRKELCKDLDFVAQPDSRFLVDFATAVARYQVRPGLGKKTALRVHGMAGELYLTDPLSYVPQLLIRTGSAFFSRAIVTLAPKRGKLRFQDARAVDVTSGRPVLLHGEEDLFERLQLPWIRPEDRSDVAELVRHVDGRTKRALLDMEAGMREEMEASNRTRKAGAGAGPVQGGLF